MEILTYLCSTPSVVGAAALDDGSIRLDLADDTTRLATLSEINAAKCLAINELIDAERNRREQDVFMYQGKQIQCDKDSITRMSIVGLNALIAIRTNNPFGVDWLCVDKTSLTLDAIGMSGMIAALEEHGAALHYHARALKNQVAAAADPDSIDIYSGWPV